MFLTSSKNQRSNYFKHISLHRQNTISDDVELFTLLPIQLKTRPYYMEHTDGDAQFINGPKLTQAEILECLKSMRDQLDKVHESTAKNISYAQAKQAKNYDACHIGKLLSVSTKVMVKDKAGEARKGDKLKAPF